MTNMRLKTSMFRWQPFSMEPVAAAAVATAPAPIGPMHDPPLRPHDEAVFLLTAAAEVEHALMMQYLFAAYSIRTDTNVPGLAQIQNELLQIAREEMGYLATVENLLHVLGGPLNFRREQSPSASEIYPFRFKLEPLTLNSLSKYVIAESPDFLRLDSPAYVQLGNEQGDRTPRGLLLI